MAFDYRTLPPFAKIIQSFIPISNTALHFMNIPWLGAFPDKVTPDIDFIDEASVLCFSCKNTFVGVGNLHMITSKFWFEYLWGPYALFLDPVLCNLRSWLHNRKPVNWTVLCASLEREWTFWDKLWIQVKKPATKESSTNNFHLAYQILVIK